LLSYKLGDVGHAAEALGLARNALPSFPQTWGAGTVRAKILEGARLLTSSFAVGLLLVAACTPAAAQAPAGEAAQPDLAQATAGEAAQPDLAQATASDAGQPDLDALMAPVALFPDPLLAAVLQASVVPLDVVMAARFLDDYAKDPTVAPDPAWDPAVLGLLAFPTVLKGMNDHLDWVQTVGDAVLDRLPDVQDSIQQVRSLFYAGGVLKSDDKQTVEVDSEIIRITPVDPNNIFVPVYDPQALIEAVAAT
jgi:Protein of unknown function (DUF3300)